MSGGVNEAFWAGVPLGPGVELLGWDENGLAAFNKPAGVLSHPNARGEEKRAVVAAGYALEGEFYAWGEGAGAGRLWLLNRLDSGTSGVILVAADEGLAGAVRAMFLRKQVRKVYHALVFGVPLKKRERWSDRLAVRKEGGRIRTQAGGNIPAEAEMTVLGVNRRASPPLSWIELTPLTGRSHQLRVQCAQRRLPIVGDATYGNFGANRSWAKATGEKRLCLHSHATQFTYAWKGREFTFAAKAPTPEGFLRAVGAGR